MIPLLLLVAIVGAFLLVNMSWFFLDRDPSLPNVRYAVEAAAKGESEGFTEASQSRKNQDNIDEEKRADDCNKEKQRNHDKGKTIRKRRRGLRQG